jgi:hypothetical protein
MEETKWRITFILFFALGKKIRLDGNNICRRSNKIGKAFEKFSFL